jgi:branched-chain amino acid transport system substrate-binding protein
MLISKTIGAATLLSVLAFAAGGTRAAEPGVTDTEIKIGVLGSLTGPAAIFGTSNLAGGTLAFEEANAAGGINGRKFTLISEDDETSPPKAIAAFKKLADQENVFAIFGPSTSAVAAALVPVMRQSDVPVFSTIYSTPAPTEPLIKNVFRVATLNDRMQGLALAEYVVKNLGVKRVGLIRQSDEYGKRGAESVLQRLGKYKEVSSSEEVFNVTDTDFTSQLLKLKGTDPDVLIIYGYPSPSAIITRQARQLGLPAKIVGSNASSSRKYPEIVGEAAAGTQNVITLQELPESDEPKMKRFREIFEKRFPELARQGRPDLTDVMGYGGAQVFLDAVKRAGRDLTRASLNKALESTKDFQTGMTLPETLTPESHEGNNAARILEIQPDLTRKLLPVTIKAE